VPSNDPTTLFTSAGMQPMVPYLLGKQHPAGQRIVDSQICFRSEDIDEIGDNRHSTFFEMLGNWSLGDYFKKEQLNWFFDFLTSFVKLDPNNLYVTVFAGDESNGIQRDNESAQIWKDLFSQKGIEAKEVDLLSSDYASTVGMQDGRIFYFDSAKNWWSRSGKPEKMPVGEPGGPDSEVFYRFDNVEHDPAYGKHCHPNCDCGQFLEIGNSVFMEYQKQENGTFTQLKQRNIDFGGGLIRMLASQANNPDIFQTDLLKPIIDKLVELSGKDYEGDNKPIMRIISDHISASVFIISQGIEPSNKLQGYILRRLIRRLISQAELLNIDNNFVDSLAEIVISIYHEPYPALKENKERIISVLKKEEAKFKIALKNGLLVFNKMTVENKQLSGEDLFNLYQSYGFPVELSLEIAAEKKVTIGQNAVNEFESLMKDHQNLSRQTSAGLFKGGLADSSEIVTSYHTTTHLLNAALRSVLGEDVWQKGSNITAERLRFDFSYPTKLSPDQIRKIEEIVNEKISQNLPVSFENLSLDEAKNQGALGVFGEKYGEVVKVYTIGDKDNYFSKEICGGPHVENTSQIKGHFKITKEEAVGSGVRRIKGVLVE
jgi:alanyl-tRNA synthetase